MQAAPDTHLPEMASLRTSPAPFLPLPPCPQLLRQVIHENEKHPQAEDGVTPPPCPPLPRKAGSVRRRGSLADSSSSPDPSPCSQTSCSRPCRTPCPRKIPA